ncbi:MAG: hypothetical protein KGJ41_16590 [Rhodospirillales bacterium]|nr:hypothetical protein [Rhodospirillales bacterium]MDE2200632.1 hypothetical protein [Rhodospirillales bacterium]MDE2573720.1 hypothetical protein [Rhodospirillales bacterium]
MRLAPYLVGLTLAGLVLAPLLLAAAPAEAATRGLPSGLADTRRECSACHVLYPPELLPARSWQALTSHLSTHFGEDASLDAPTTAAITKYLVDHAADSRYGSRDVMWHLSPTQTPQRITDMPFWRSIHRRLLQPGVGTGPGIRTAADCARCHDVRSE